MIRELIGENDPFLRRIPLTYNFTDPIDSNIVEERFPDLREPPEHEPEELKKILLRNMEYHVGYGLSANQIGLPYTVFTMIKDDTPIVCFNPKIVDYSEETDYIREGCLTFPGMWFAVERAMAIQVKYNDENENECLGIFNGLSARIFQHEMEHMDGELFIDNISDMKLHQVKKRRKVYLRRMKRNVKKQQEI